MALNVLWDVQVGSLSLLQIDCDKIVSTSTKASRILHFLSHSNCLVSEPQTPLPQSLSLPTFLKECDNTSKHSGSACYVPGTIFAYRHVTHIDCQACEQNPSWDHATHSQQDLKDLELKHLPRITQSPGAEGGEKMQYAKAYSILSFHTQKTKYQLLKNKLTKRKRRGLARSSVVGIHQRWNSPSADQWFYRVEEGYSGGLPRGSQWNLGQGWDHCIY